MKLVEWMARLLFGIPVMMGISFLILPMLGISVDMVLSGSMEPALKTGGIVFTDTKERIFDDGDIITFRVKDTYVTHRIIEKKTEGFVTKGDANENPDAELVKDVQIIGKAVFFIPYLGYGISFLKRKTVFCLLLAILVQEWIISEVKWKGAHSKGLCKKRL